MIFLAVATLFFIGLFVLTTLASAMRRKAKKDSKKIFKEMGSVFFYRPFHLFFFPEEEYASLLFAAISAQNICRFFFLTSLGLFLWQYVGLFPLSIAILIGAIALLTFFTLGDYLPKILSSKFSTRSIWIAAPIASPFLFISFPLTYIFLKISSRFFKKIYFDYLNEPMGEAKQEIFEIIQEADVSNNLNLHDKKLIESVVDFQARIAREVMVPRVDLFSLSAETSIKEAAERLQKEGYSRVPVFRNTIDQIVGVLMYKDILNKYMEAFDKNDPKILEAPIETIVKGVIYTPETKKISILLQEFRKKQVHLAIVVDEYGGTEGIVTIEDILEEIVGEIEDEYDEEEDQFIAQPDGSWIVDARMSILDVDEQLGLEIPQEGDYDTIGGYIFHRAGSIPSKGFTIKLDDLELEVLKSNDRRVEKVRIRPTKGHMETATTHEPSSDQ